VNLTSEPGTYALLIRVPQAQRMRAGSLGWFHFSAGWYIYSGSALGPGGLAARLGRHARAHKTPYWHIDYLLRKGHLAGAWLAAGRQRRECVLARRLIRSPKAQIVAPHFGASDCHCLTHLVYFPRRSDAANCMLEMG
jgi:Uri superfamily endonuclease